MVFKKFFASRLNNGAQIIFDLETDSQSGTHIMTKRTKLLPIFFCFLQRCAN